MSFSLQHPLPSRLVNELTYQGCFSCKGASNNCSIQQKAAATCVGTPRQVLPTQTTCLNLARFKLQRDIPKHLFSPSQAANGPELSSITCWCCSMWDSCSGRTSRADPHQKSRDILCWLRRGRRAAVWLCLASVYSPKGRLMDDLEALNYPWDPN